MVNKAKLSMEVSRVNGDGTTEFRFARSKKYEKADEDCFAAIMSGQEEALMRVCMFNPFHVDTWYSFDNGYI